MRERKFTRRENRGFYCSGGSFAARSGQLRTINARISSSIASIESNDSIRSSFFLGVIGARVDAGSFAHYLEFVAFA
jgi:hypothetical protein